MVDIRAKREKEQYNRGLDREKVNTLTSHGSCFYVQRRIGIDDEELVFADGKIVLEIGSTFWAWLDGRSISPKEMHCINISEKELEKGVTLSVERRLKPTFHLMDANKLEFDDKKFDMIIGRNILHHLNFNQALDEIKRTLKPNGRMYFLEPLAVNPVGNLVRWATPHARTLDEKPLGYEEIAELNKRFDCKFYYEELLSTGAGMVSRFLFKNPDNILTRSAFYADLWIDKHIPALRPYFRIVNIVGTKRA